MTEDKHTPGPWHADGSGYLVMAMGGGPTVGEAFWDTLGLPENRARKVADANMALMAAAPDLLAACQEFVRKVECGEARSKRSYAQMKSAIEKATT